MEREERLRTQFCLLTPPSPSPQGRLTVINAGAAGTTSSYMSLCHKLRLPQNTDLVFV